MFQFNAVKQKLNIFFSLCIWCFHPVQATCCSDHLHCCPSNTICDLEQGVCKSGETLLPLLKKISAAPNDGKQETLWSVCMDENQKKRKETKHTCWSCVFCDFLSWQLYVQTRKWLVPIRPHAARWPTAHTAAVQCPTWVSWRNITAPH